MRLLLIEDYPPLSRALERGLREAGYAVDVAADGERGVELAEAVAYDLVILDLMLPGLDGYAVLERLRGARDPTGVIILTARQGVSDRIKGLDLGADDYVMKPFAFDELLARVRSVIRRRAGQSGASITVGDLEIDPAARTVRRGVSVIPLSTREYALLEFLALRRGQTVTRAEIVEHVYDFGSAPSSNVVDVYIGYLRRKIDEGRDVKLIHTRRGLGYCLADAG